MCENWQSKRPKQIAKVGAAATAAAGASAAMGALLNGHRRCIGQGKGRAGQEGTGLYGVGKWQFIKSFEVSKISNCSQSAN